jgi:uncharacterized protein
MKSNGSPRSVAKPARAWQRMLSGRRLDLLDPSPLDIEIEDIAHGLARVSRWNGQTKGQHSFSVAQHSLFVEAISRQLRQELPARTSLTILLHDAAEYVIGDMISPFKAVLGETYKGVEARILSAVMLRFGLPATMIASVQKLAKEADGIAAYHEAVSLAGFEESEARQIFGMHSPLGSALKFYLQPWPTEEAQKRFLARFEELDRFTSSPKAS